MTKAQIVAKLGGDFDENLAELAREQAAAERLGVELDRDIVEQPILAADAPMPVEEPPAPTRSRRKK